MYHPQIFICKEEDIRSNIFSDGYSLEGMAIKEEFPDFNLNATNVQMFEPNSSDKSKDKTYSCSQCDASFSKPYKLKCHVTQVHENKRPFKCTVCDESFKVKHHLQRP